MVGITVEGTVVLGTGTDGTALGVLLDIIEPAVWGWGKDYLRQKYE